jgi:hypothetical protein
MTYVKLNHTDVDDDRWLEAGADAFALHYAALVWCDRRLSDGRISKTMATRVALAVPTERAAAAIDALERLGFWRADGYDYVIEKFFEHAFPAEQVKRTRERWSEDKARRRQHSLGDHALCKDPKFCPAIRGIDSTVESTEESKGGSTRRRSRIDQTRPDQTGGKGLGLGLGARLKPRRPPLGLRSPRPRRAEENRPRPAYRKPLELLLGALRDNDRAVEQIVLERNGHEWRDDGSGISCDTCGLPQNHLFHYQAAAS